MMVFGCGDGALFRPVPILLLQIWFGKQLQIASAGSSADKYGSKSLIVFNMLDFRLLWLPKTLA